MALKLTESLSLLQLYLAFLSTSHGLVLSMRNYRSICLSDKINITQSTSTPFSLITLLSPPCCGLSSSQSRSPPPFVLIISQKNFDGAWSVNRIDIINRLYRCEQQLQTFCDIDSVFDHSSLSRMTRRINIMFVQAFVYLIDQ